MDICEYVEDVLGMKLLDYQKELLKKMHESYKENKPLRFIPSCRACGRSMILALLTIVEMHEKEATDDKR